MNWSAIVQALETYVATLLPGEDIAWENVRHNSTPGTPYFRVTHTVVDTEPATIGSHGVMETEGILVVGFNYPAGRGSGASLEKADALAAGFVPGQSITAGSGTIIFSKSTLEHTQPSSEPDWWTRIFSVHYRAFHNY